MKRTSQLANYLIVIMVVLIVFMIMEFLALLDIYHEYVSKSMVTNIAPETLGKYPAFSNNTLEWRVIVISLDSSIILIIISLILSTNLYKRIRREELDI